MQANDLTSIDPNVDYTQSCESRLMEFEYKLQEVEASLLILESQLASIPHLDEAEESIEEGSKDLNLPPVQDDEEAREKIPEDDFGVPMDAIKLKMKTEGVDPAILDKLHSKQN